MDKGHIRKCPGHGSAEEVVIKQMVGRGGWKSFRSSVMTPSLGTGAAVEHMLQDMYVIHAVHSLTPIRARAM